MTPIQQAIAILEEDALTNRIERALEVLRGVPQTPKEKIECWDCEGEGSFREDIDNPRSTVCKRCGGSGRMDKPADTRPDREGK